MVPVSEQTVLIIPNAAMEEANKCLSQDPDDNR